MAIEVRNDVAPALVGGMAFATGQGLYDERQAQIARQEQAEQNRIAAQLYAQNQQRAANERMAMFQHAAGLQDMYGRAALGEWGAQQQHGRMLEMDDRNFAQQKQRDEWNAALQDKSWENRLNAQGKARKAESDAQRAALDKYFSGWDMSVPGNKKQRDAAYAQHAAIESGLKDAHYLMPDPPKAEDIVKESTWTDAEGNIWAVDPSTRKPSLQKPSERISDNQIAGRQKALEAQIAGQEKIARIHAHNDQVKHWHTQRQKVIDALLKDNEKARIDNDKVPILTVDEATEQADKRMGPLPQYDSGEPSKLDGLLNIDEAHHAAEWEGSDGGGAWQTGQLWKDLEPADKQRAIEWMGRQKAAIHGQQVQKIAPQVAQDYDRWAANNPGAKTWNELSPAKQRETIDRVLGGQAPPQQAPPSAVPSGGGGFQQETAQAAELETASKAALAAEAEYAKAKQRFDSLPTRAWLDPMSDGNVPYRNREKAQAEREMQELRKKAKEARAKEAVLSQKLQRQAAARRAAEISNLPTYRDYDELPSGEVFLDPEGHKRLKP